MMPSENHLKTKPILFTLFFICAALLAISCKECPTEPEPGTVTLSTAYVTTKSVYLDINVSDPKNSSDIRIKRDTTIILETSLPDGDTLIVDDNLQPGKTYSYRGFLMDKDKVISSGDALPVTTMDTTYHEIYAWQIDTLGISGEIRDAWIVDEDDIWVVGNIETDSGEYNAARWNGDEWELMRIVNPDPIFNIWYFSKNDIWVVLYGYPVHWDGNRWTLFHFHNMGINASSLALWGTSSSNMYFVGLEGSIVHYDGSGFKKMESGTDCKLEDVYGIDEKHVWAVGTESDNSRSVILFYDGEIWITLHNTDNERKCWSNSIWTDSQYLLFLNGGSGRYMFDLIQGELSKDESAGRWFGYSIEGLAYNDIFTSNAGSEILHFNGSTWYLYTQIQEHFDTWGLIKTIRVKDNLVVAGGEYYTGLYGLPIIIRGYR